MYQRDWTKEMDDLIGKNHDFILDILNFINSMPSMINNKDIDKDILMLLKKVQEMKKSADDNQKKLLDLITSTDLKTYICKLKYENINFLEKYESMTQNYSNLFIREATDVTTYSTEVKKTFNYFYGKLIHGKGYNRTYGPPKTKVSEIISIEEFRRISSTDSSCPYCDITQLEFDSSSVDHYFPKSIYPLLSIFPKNLIVSCSACNDRIKKDNLPLPNIHPYFDKIENFFDFSIDDNFEIKIKINEHLEDFDKRKICNYLSLFNLEERYKIQGKMPVKKTQDMIRKNLNKIFRNNHELSKDYILKCLNDEISFQIEDLAQNKTVESLVKLKLDFLKNLNKNKDYQNEILEYFSEEYLVGQNII